MIVFIWLKDSNIERLKKVGGVWRKGERNDPVIIAKIDKLFCTMNRIHLIIVDDVEG